MSDEVYIKLREFLDRFPLGYPETDSGVEMEILKRLFTEDEASIAVLLSPMPEEAAAIAVRTGLDEKELAEKLEAMSKKGLIFRTRRAGKTKYNTAPFMIGLYEYSIKRIDGELAALFKKYYDTAYMDEMGRSNVPGFKILPLSEKLGGETALFPFLKLKEDIRAARKIAVTECICRVESDLTGEKCDHPRENCLSFGAAAEYYIENGMGREINADEAVKIVEEADRAGLVHASANVKHLSNICNCCPCCCASMKGITTKGHDKHLYMNALFEAVVDGDGCIACEECVGRCPVDAIVMEDVAIVSVEKCLGCGLCAGVCESEAITMVLKEKIEEPFDRIFDMGMAIIKGKKGA